MTTFRCFGLRAPSVFVPTWSVPPAIHRLWQHLLLAVTPAFAFGTGCKPEPCAHYETIPVEAQATPFVDGTSVFSKCARCPELPKMDGVEASGPATACRVGFNDAAGDRALVDCWYGPGGNTGSSISNGAITDVPNLIEYCETNCPDLDALHGCSLTADANGVNTFVCHYGQTCG